MKRSKCPKCGSKDLSDGENDFIYDIFRGEVLIQFCNKCHEEWIVKTISKEGMVGNGN